jgi:hypothetical protein
MCPVCSKPRGWHDNCLYLAISWRLAGQYDIDADGVMVRLLAPVCYLCGVAPSEHAEHVHPRRRGGLDLWCNMAGACAACNWRKGVQLDHLTADQAARAAKQQTKFRGVFERITDRLVIEGLAARGRRRRRRYDHPELDMEDMSHELASWFDDTGAPLERVQEYVKGAVDLMVERGWIQPADVDVAYEVETVYEPDVTAEA